MSNGLIADNTPLVAGEFSISASQSIVSGAWTAISYDTESYDYGGLHDNSVNPTRITLPHDGIYLISAWCVYAVNAVGNRFLEIYKNGALDVVHRAGQAAIGSKFSLNVSVIEKFSKNDYVESYTFQNSGGNLNVTDSEIEIILLRIV